MATKKTSKKAHTRGLSMTRRYTSVGVPALDAVEWRVHDVVINGADGKPVFELKGVEVPQGWSDRAATIVAEKYFRTYNGERENSAYQVIDRVVTAIESAGWEQGLFAIKPDAVAFGEELRYLLVNQMFAFNSPVWFNIGVPGVKQQASACFIQSAQDDMEALMGLQRDEAMLFKGGSGTGTNLSPVRSSYENLSNGGIASGPVSFMTGYDAWAGVTKSGGGTRRAAKMDMLNHDHPDILTLANGRPGFIGCKAEAEQLAHDLIATGKYSGEFHIPGNAYERIGFQNANNSVRVSDDFMRAAISGGTYQTKKVTTGEAVHTYSAAMVMDEIAKAAWFCGDPGIQYDTTINDWHTCPNSGRINGSNPCCFVGETLVDTSEGRITIGELERMSSAGEKLPMAFSFDREGAIPVLRQIKRAWKAGDAAKLMRVTTQKGLSFLCTPEHEFLTYNEGYVEAQHLTAGTRLRKVNRTVNTQRSGRRYILSREVDGRDTFLQSRWMWEQAYGPVPEGMEVHHLNEDPTDDRLSNLVLMDKTEHRISHAEGAANPMFLDVQTRRLVDVWEAIESTPRRTHKKAAQKVTPARWNTYIRDNDLVGTVPLAGSPTHGGRIQGMGWDMFTARIEAAQLEANDRIESVEPVTPVVPVAVYDIDVEGTHNFGITSEDATHSIVVSNSEYMFLDDSACNLGSFNLKKFLKADGSFDVGSFAHACEIAITAMEILVGYSSYPNEKIAANSRDFRPLGIGYANLGALLMSMGLAYDSDEGRSVAGAITSIMSGHSYAQSARVAGFAVGPFPGYAANKGPMGKVIDAHSGATVTWAKDAPAAFTYLWDAAIDGWNAAVTLGQAYGFRNSQISVLAPTGTISFMMDCDTTGGEPMTFLMAMKKLVGGGQMRMPNLAVVEALRNLGYDKDFIASVEIEVASTGKMPLEKIRAEHKKVFQTAVGSDAISVSGHLKMMAAQQPFLSGAISKTVNMPSSATVDDVRNAYLQGWELKLKAVAIYRDGCKRSQPLSDSTQKSKDVAAAPAGKAWGERKRLAADRDASVHRFTVGGQKGYVTVGLDEDNKPAEIFLTVSKGGSTLHGFADMWATAMSLGLQHGVPLSQFIAKFRGMQFLPAGFTDNPQIRSAQSLGDYISKWLEQKFITPPEAEGTVDALDDVHVPVKTPGISYDGPPCSSCGTITSRAGSCYVCPTCATTTGCG